METSEDFDLDSLPKLSEHPSNGLPAGGAVSAPFTHFSRKDKLREKDGKIWGNWNDSFAGACIDPFDNRYIECASVVSKEEVGNCSGSGKIIVKYVHN